MASRSRKTILSNPLDDINPQGVSKVLSDKKLVSEISATSSKKSVIKKTVSKATKTTAAAAKLKSEKKTPVKKTVKKAVKKDADPSIETSEALSKFDELAQVVILDAK
jgi:hypothetical protein